MLSNHLILCHPLLLLSSIFLSIGVFSNELTLCIRWSKYWIFSISPCNGYSGLISFRIDWFDLLAVQETPKSLLQHHNSKTSLLLHSGFFYGPTLTSIMTTGKIIALNIRMFVGKVMSQLFNTLSMLVIAFLPKWVSSTFMAAVTICSDFGAQENTICRCFHFISFYLPWSDGIGCYGLSFFNAEF